MTGQRRTRPEREAPELRAMIERMANALVRRAESGDLFAVEALSDLSRRWPVYLARAVWRAHTGPAAYSYGDIGRELGVTRQAAWELGEQGKRAA